MWLDNCSNEEVVTLVAIAALAASLPKGNLAEYADALSEITRYFNNSAPNLVDHNPSPRSVAVTRDVRVTRKWKG